MAGLGEKHSVVRRPRDGRDEEGVYGLLGRRDTAEVGLVYEVVGGRSGGLNKERTVCPMFRKTGDKLRLLINRIQLRLDGIWLRLFSPQVCRVLKNKRYFDHWERLGFHVLPVHFHQPIPDTRTLGDEIWDDLAEPAGVAMNVETQIKYLKEVFPTYIKECSFPHDRTETPYEYYRKNGAFLSVDAEVYHCMIRHFHPRRIIEVGSGSTTYLAARACRMNDEKDNTFTELVVIDPFPNETVGKGFPGLSTLIRNPVEKMDPRFFLQLKKNDILFIDSSHVAGIGGDVNHEYLEIIPRLNPGVIVHAHDIYFPAEYPRKWIFEDRFFWTEQYILQAFLSFNRAFHILWASSYMHIHYPHMLKAAFPSYANLPQDCPQYPHVWPSSFWFRRKDAGNPVREKTRADT
jgi:hypothetical protein